VRKGLIVLTGVAGSGKTTAVLNAARRLMSAGYSVGGCITREIRREGVRIGFEIIDLTTGKAGILASTAIKEGPRVGKYTVNLKDLELVAAASVEEAIVRSDIIVLDEIGPMELMSPEFKRAVRNALNSIKPILAVVHMKINDDLAKDMRGEAEFKFFLEEKTRAQISDRIYDLLLGLLLKKDKDNANRLS
jgi:nucleoside-triphosphatase